jgi:elongation factor Ts
MTTISAKQVMDLRSQTGLPMMKCKQALESASGDYEKAIEILRKEGLKAADAKASRTTSEGLIRGKVAPDGSRGSLVAVLCETEPVSKTPDFTGFVDALLAHVEKQGPPTVEALLAQKWAKGGTVDEALKTLVAKIGENMKVSGAARFDAATGEYVAQYVHYNGKAAAMTLLTVKQVTPAFREAAKELCQHVVFAKPAALARDEIAKSVIDKELEIYRGQVEQDPKMKGKPPQVVEKIVSGKLEAFYKERVLPEQVWYKPEPSASVAQVLEAHGAAVKRFVAFQVG